MRNPKRALTRIQRELPEAPVSAERVDALLEASQEALRAVAADATVSDKVDSAQHPAVIALRKLPDWREAPLHLVAYYAGIVIRRLRRLAESRAENASAPMKT